VTQQLGGETALVCVSEEGSDAEAVSVANSRRDGMDAAERGHARDRKEQCNRATSPSLCALQAE
jgi:hypothetical protein